MSRALGSVFDRKNRSTGWKDDHDWGVLSYPTLQRLVRTVAQSERPKKHTGARSSKKRPPVFPVYVSRVYGFQDLTNSMKDVVRRACEERGIPIESVKVLSPTKVLLP